jgi:hypothetical protein
VPGEWMGSALPQQCLAHPHQAFLFFEIFLLNNWGTLRQLQWIKQQQKQQRIKIEHLLLHPLLSYFMHPL